METEVMKSVINKESKEYCHFYHIMILLFCDFWGKSSFINLKRCSITKASKLSWHPTEILRLSTLIITPPPLSGIKTFCKNFSFKRFLKIQISEDNKKS